MGYGSLSLWQVLQSPFLSEFTDDDLYLPYFHGAQLDEDIDKMKSK